MVRRVLLFLAPLALGACATIPAPAEVPAVQTRGVVSAADPRAATCDSVSASAGFRSLVPAGSATPLAS